MTIKEKLDYYQDQYPKEKNKLTHQFNEIQAKCKKTQPIVRFIEQQIRDKGLQPAVQTTKLLSEELNDCKKFYNE